MGLARWCFLTHAHTCTPRHNAALLYPHAGEAVFEAIIQGVATPRQAHKSTTELYLGQTTPATMITESIPLPTHFHGFKACRTQDKSGARNQRLIENCQYRASLNVNKRQLPTVSIHQFIISSAMQELMKCGRTWGGVREERERELPHTHHWVHILECVKAFWLSLWVGEVSWAAVIRIYIEQEHDFTFWRKCVFFVYSVWFACLQGSAQRRDN